MNKEHTTSTYMEQDISVPIYRAQVGESKEWKTGDKVLVRYINGKRVMAYYMKLLKHIIKDTRKKEDIPKEEMACGNRPCRQIWAVDWNVYPDSIKKFIKT